MRIEITQNCTGIGDYHWSLYTGPDHINEYKGTSKSLGEAFEKITRAETLNSIDYREDFRPLCEELANELDKYVSFYSPEGKVLYRALRILQQTK